MAFAHTHKPETENGTKSLRLAFILNFCFALLEVVGGLLTNSIAILADALHDLGDSFSLAMAWYSSWVSRFDMV